MRISAHGPLGICRSSSELMSETCGGCVSLYSTPPRARNSVARDQVSGGKVTPDKPSDDVPHIRMGA